MANKTVQLKSSDGDNLFPKCGSLEDNSIGTNNIQDGAVTSAKLDWGTIVDWIESTTTEVYGGNVLYLGPQYLKFDNGIMIVYGLTPEIGVAANSYSNFSYNLDTNFLETPTVSVGLDSDSTSGDIGYVSVANCNSSTSSLKFRLFNCGGTARYPRCSFIATGRWK